MSDHAHFSLAQHWEGLCVSEPNSKPPVIGVTLEHLARVFPADAEWLIPVLLEPLIVFNRWWWRVRQVGKHLIVVACKRSKTLCGMHLPHCVQVGGLIAPGGLTGSPGVICGGLPGGMESAKWETGLDNRRVGAGDRWSLKFGYEGHASAARCTTTRCFSLQI